MCGITGWVDYDRNISNETDTIIKMRDSVAHRGPDEKGIYVEPNVLFGQRRLAIIDEKGGRQPMTFDAKTESYTLIYNGELYNTAEIRNALSIRGYSFHGYSDTEVVLKAYAEWKEDCLNRMNGIFAFAVWEHNSKTLFLARDRIGVKPLFYYPLKDGIIFASEIKAIMLHPEVKHVIDEAGLKQIMLLGPGRSPGVGCIKNIYDLLPGEYLKLTKKGLSTNTYWRLTAKEHTENKNETVERTRELIFDAVKSQLVSDVPLACFLSGGLDSSIISKIVSDYYKSKNEILTTYSVDYEDNDKYFEANSYQPDSDNKYIALMSKAIGSRHIRIVLDNLDVAKSVVEATSARDLPGMGDVDSSLLLFARKVKENHTVCLSGECADELFAGYPWYHNEELLFSDTFPWSRSINLRKTLFNTDFIGSDADEFVQNEYRKTVLMTDCLDSDDRLNRRIREMFALNFFWFMQTLIDRKDRMTAYVGLEARVPLCDYRLVEYAFNMPWEFKALAGREKGIMREAFKGILPDEIIARKKNPYPKTFNPIFADYVKNEAARLVYDKKSILSELINKQTFEALFGGTIKLSYPWYGQLMREPQIFAYLIQLDAFFKNFKLDIVR